MQTTKKQPRWIAKAMGSGSKLNPVPLVHTTKISITGNARSMIAWGKSGRRAKVKTNVRRYSISGTTHNNGADAISVVIYWVTPSSRDEGINASTIHMKRSRGLTSVLSSLTGFVAINRLCNNVIAPHE